ncbi:MAG TPA: hypothetical protein VMD59_00810, partial [Acidimicrobiales bacterium]|nr:hypothetical protein [Acidimicrobiales bacterium]
LSSWGFDLEGVELPKDPDVRLVRRARCVARHGIEILNADDSVEARVLRALFERRLKGPGSDQDAEVFNRRDYDKFGGPNLVRLAEDVIVRAEADCLPRSQ